MRLSDKAAETSGRVTALLGPTNTGKTHYAIEQMASYKSGVIGFPLRLLARENYERLVRLKGRDAVALVTGEEKIVPRNARYFSCTVESMPLSQDFEFVGVDEIQLCADPDRGHVFTDRLLQARGTEQTMFMGADTIKPLLRLLIPRIEFSERSRLSALSYKGYKKLTRMPKRSAIVAFSVNDVYAIAELVRRHRGGTAVVLGALSPRTRNKQVEMYQAGEVDFLVATDAIGMGLNMDIHHVALGASRKFDGQQMRSLKKAEMAQIAGRAGRYKRDGTFGVTNRVRELAPEMVEAIEMHTFQALDHIYWRNSYLDFSNVKALARSLEQGSSIPVLAKGRPADDYKTLMQLMRREAVMAQATGAASVRLLWDVCQVPDFRQTLSDQHHDLVAQLFAVLISEGRIGNEFVAQQISLLDNSEGNVDSLMARLAHIRTWTYITHKSEWLDHASQWQEKARAIEDKLSDALHEKLIRRFVDRRAAVLMRAIKDGGALLAGVRANGDVIVEGQEVGKLVGFRFFPDEEASGEDYKAVMAAARSALGPEIKRRIKEMLKAENKQFTLKDDGTICYQPNATNPMPGDVIGRVSKGQEQLRPQIELQDSSFIEGQDKAAVTERLNQWLWAHIDEVLAPLLPLVDEEGLDGAARGIAFQLHEALGIVPRAQLEDVIAGLDEEGRAALRKRRVRMGPVLVFLPALNKPAAIRLRALLWSLWHEKPLPAPVPADGMTSISVTGQKDNDPAFYRAIGYPVYGPRAIRVDMLDRVVCAVYDTAEKGKFQAQHQMAEWLGCPIADLYGVLEAMGHKKIHDPAEMAEQKEKEDAAKDKAEEKETVSKAESDAVKPEEISERKPETKAEKEEEQKEKTLPSSEDGEDKSPSQSEAEDKVAAEPAPQAKPELATFALRRGKAYGGRRKPEKKRKENKTARSKSFSSKKKEKTHRSQPRVVTAGPQNKAENSPFAVLQKLKENKKS